MPNSLHYICIYTHMSISCKGVSSSDITIYHHLLENMKRTHLASFSSKYKTQQEEGDTDGNERIIMNHYNNYKAGTIN